MLAMIRPARLLTALTVATLLGVAGPGARAQETLDEINQRLRIAAQKVEKDVKDCVAEADQIGKRNPVQAIDKLRSAESILSVDRALAPERRAELIRLVDARIRQYNQAKGRAPAADLEEKARISREQQQERDTRNLELSRLYRDAAELQRRGKFNEAGDIYDRMRAKHGRAAGPGAFYERANRANSALRELRGIRDERDRRYAVAYRDFMRATLIPEGDIEFPKDWKEKTERRLKVKLDPKEVKLLKALNTLITTEFKGQPLQGVLDEFKKRYDIAINLDGPALEQAGVTGETPVNLNARQVTLRGSLKRMLGDVGLTMVIRNGEVLVTTPQRASTMLVTKAYYVGDLLTLTNQTWDPAFNQLQAAQTIWSLMQTIQGLEPTSWESGGGPGKITFDPVRMAIVISQSAEMQYMIGGQLR